MSNIQSDYPIIRPDDFREVMRCWVSGVAVVTSRLGKSVRGVTVSSFASVSMTPPMVVISLAKRLHTYHMIQKSRIFAVSLLGEHQQEVSARFAGQVSELDDRFQDEPSHSELTGAPVFDRAVAFMDCRLMAEYDVGLNVILLGVVEAGRVQNSVPPLIYSNRQYWRLNRALMSQEHS